MTSRYTRDNYSADVLPKGLHRDVVTLITDAVMEMGWHVEVKHIRAILRAATPNEKQSIPFSASAPPGNLNSIKRKIAKYADPEVGAAERRATAAAKREERERQEAEANAELERVAAEKREAALRKEAEVKGEVKLAGERAVENQKPDENPTIVNIEPLMVERHGKTVASTSTLVRTWSDPDHVDYACAVPGCDFVSDNRYGPSRGHRRAHTLKGEATADKYSKNAVEEVEVTVRNGASEALAGALKAAIEKGVDWSDLDAAVTVLAERATALLPKPEPVKEPEPSEAEALLDQIRGLVGVDPSLQAEVDALKAELAEVRTERDRLTSEREALRDLLTDQKAVS